MLAVFKQRNTETGSKCRSQDYTKPLERKDFNCVVLDSHTRESNVHICLFVCQGVYFTAVQTVQHWRDPLSILADMTGTDS